MYLVVVLLGLICSTAATADQDKHVLLKDEGSNFNFSSEELNRTKSLWIGRRYQITCCLGGEPKADVAMMKENLVRNWTAQAVEETGFLAAHDSIEFDALGIARTPCKRFQGTYQVSSKALFASSMGFGIGVRCQCPDIGKSLDRNCRHLPPCKNSGYRAFKNHLRCVCPEPYFGDVCEKYCDKGRRIKNEQGVDRCSCQRFYTGEECSERVCLNGATNIGRRCLCTPEFVGFHCEIVNNRTVPANHFTSRNDLFGKDPSGTIFSLIMLVVLLLSMYLLIKRRSQMQQRLISHRYFEDIFRPNNINDNPFQIADSTADRIAVIQPPPCYSQAVAQEPYSAAPQNCSALVGQSNANFGQNNNTCNFQPPPSYEDATKTENDPNDLSDNDNAEGNPETINATSGAVQTEEPSTSTLNSLALVAHKNHASQCDKSGKISRSESRKSI